MVLGELDMSGNHEILQGLVNELACKPEQPDIYSMLTSLIQEQRRSNDVIQNLAESISQLAHAIIEQNEPSEEEDGAQISYGGLDG